jgi:hypothetical protein
MQSNSTRWHLRLIQRSCIALSGMAFCVPVAAQQQLALVDAPAPAFDVPQEPAASPTPKANPCSQPNGSIGEPGVHPATVPCTQKRLNWYERFSNGPRDHPLTPLDKGWLATRNLVDPFNLITIGGDAAIAVGYDSHSAYGPGMPGFARYSGVSFTQDMIAEFFGTFAIPSIAHQDPHYHRMEHAKVRRRAWHCIAQVFWTESDSGRMMPNYANIVGFGIDDEISNLFVPGRRTNAPATALRYSTALATAPINNFVNEFLPDIASHIHVQIVIVQRIINQVADKETINSVSGPGGDAVAGP